MGRIEMNVAKCLLEDVSLRKRRNELGIMKEYAVLKGSVLDNFDDFGLTRKYYGKRTKSAVFMCFQHRIYGYLLIGETYSFEGFVSLALGNTYLVVEEAFDQEGTPIGKGQTVQEIEEDKKLAEFEEKAA